MKASEILIAAKKLIEDPKNWTQWTMARNCFGYPVRPESNSAVCFCSVGALIRTSNTSAIAHEYLNSITLDPIDYYNDTRLHSEVMNIWDKAITKAMEDEK